MKRKILLAITMVLTTALLCGCDNKNESLNSNSNYEEEIKLLKERINVLEEKNNNNNNNNNDNNDNSNQELNKTDYESKIKELESQIETLKNVNSQTETITKTEVITKSDDSKIKELESEIERLKAELNSKEDKGNDNIFLVSFDANGKRLAYGSNSYAIPSSRWEKSDRLEITVSNGNKYGDYFYRGVLPYIDYAFGAESIEVLIGWYTEPNGNGEQITSDTIINLKSNITLYAYTKEKVKFSYECINQDVCSSGTEYFAKESTIKDIISEYPLQIDGYDIEGIYNNSSKDVKYDMNYVISGDETFYINHVSK